MPTPAESIRKLHIWCGLLVFSQFAVYGITGFTAALRTTLARPKIAQSTRYVPFTPQPGETNKAQAARIYELLDLPFTRPMPDWYLQHTPDGHLLLDFYNINGIYRVTVLENEGRLRIEDIRNDLWLFLEDIHAVRSEPGPHFRLLRLWAAWNEFGMWALLGVTVSGLYLALPALRRLRIRTLRGLHLLLGLTAAPFLLLYAITARWKVAPLLTKLHHTAGLWYQGWPWQLWNDTVFLVSLALLAIAITGICLWYRRRRERVSGLILLALNLTVSLSLLVLIRSRH